eukprot:TRINITY_DN47507_c0_g1_i1.p1 TRINITY_DN47507_c0_g1~~TRINITY_DN47507_c0_g1_i1.p1  ORF type:complete len:319 (+),score=85.13 TRINITY_DN47507_c0_g1_i1:51-1007(+)
MVAPPDGAAVEAFWAEATKACEPSEGCLQLKPGQWVWVQYVGAEDDKGWSYGADEFGQDYGWFPSDAVRAAPESSSRPQPHEQSPGAVRPAAPQLIDSSGCASGGEKLKMRMTTGKAQAEERRRQANLSSKALDEEDKAAIQRRRAKSADKIKKVHTDEARRANEQNELMAVLNRRRAASDGDDVPADSPALQGQSKETATATPTDAAPKEEAPKARTLALSQEEHADKKVAAPPMPPTAAEQNKPKPHNTDAALPEGAAATADANAESAAATALAPVEQKTPQGATQEVIDLDLTAHEPPRQEQAQRQAQGCCCDIQ